MTHSPDNEMTARFGSGKSRLNLMLWLVSLIAVVVLLAAPTSRANAAHRKKHGHARHARKPTPSPTPPTPTPKPTPAFKPVVLIAGGTGTVNAPTGESPAVLDTHRFTIPPRANSYSLIR